MYALCTPTLDACFSTESSRCLTIKCRVCHVYPSQWMDPSEGCDVMWWYKIAHQNMRMSTLPSMSLSIQFTCQQYYYIKPNWFSTIGDTDPILADISHYWPTKTLSVVYQKSIWSKNCWFLTSGPMLDTPWVRIQLATSKCPGCSWQNASQWEQAWQRDMVDRRQTCTTVWTTATLTRVNVMNREVAIDRLAWSLLGI
jgi:hypothetical protein